MAIELAPGREQTRARYPDESGYVERTAFASSSGIRNRARRSSCCRRGRSSTRGSGRGRSRTWRATSASSRSTGGQRPLRPPIGAGGLRRAGVRRGRARRAGRDGDRARDDRGLLARSATRADPRHRPSRARRGRDLHGPSYAEEASRSTSAPASPGRTSTTRTRAGRSTTSTSGCATTAASSSSSSRACSASRTRRSRSRTASAGARDDPGDADHRPVRAAVAPEEARKLARSCTAPSSSSTEDRTRSPTHPRRRARRARGRRPLLLDGGGHAPHARDPVLFNLLVRDFAERLA